jgi:WD40 repeat protein
MRVLQGNDSAIRCLAYSPDGRLLAAGDEVGHVHLWSLPSGEEVADIPREKGTVECLAFSPSGWLALGLVEEIFIWNTAIHEGVTLQAIEADGNLGVNLGRSHRPAHKGGTRGLAWHPDGKFLASCGWDNEVRFWTEELATRWEPVRAPEPMMALAFSSDGKRLALAGSRGTQMLLDMPQRKADDELKHDRGLFSLACSCDGRLVAAGDTRGDIVLWDTTGETAPRTLRGHEWTVYGLAFTPDGNSLVSGSADETVRLWEPGAGRLVETFRWHSRWVTSVAVSPDGMTAASGSADGTVVVWDLADA